MVFPVRYAQEGVVKQSASGMLSENFFIFKALEMPFPMFFRGEISKSIKDINTMKYVFLEVHP